MKSKTICVREAARDPDIYNCEISYDGKVFTLRTFNLDGSYEKKTTTDETGWYDYKYVMPECVQLFGSNIELKILDVMREIGGNDKTLFGGGDGLTDKKTIKKGASEVAATPNTATEFLKKELKQKMYEKMETGKINWLDDEFYDSWDKVRGRWNNLIKPSNKEEYEMDTSPKVDKWFFLAHQNDEIIGKPQLIEGVMKRIPLIRLTAQTKTARKKEGEDEAQKYKIARYVFFDERYDKRYDGAMLDAFAMDFWAYRLVDSKGKEYYVFSQEKLPQKNCTFKGMKIELDDIAEISKSLKIKSLARFFMCKSFEPDVKILTKKQIIEFTKTREVKLEDWRQTLSYHPLGTFNRYPEEVENLNSAQVLSGKVDGYPLHTCTVGRAGTTKTMGLIETLDHKFNETPHIADAGNVRIRGLVPSFKTAIVDVGHLARAERFAFVDELGKMIAFELNKHQNNTENILGEFNDLLEHKDRFVGSGNTGMVGVQANAKFRFVTNPVNNMSTIYSHCGIIDITTMSRMLWWVQDEDEQKFVLSPKGISRVPPQQTQSYIPKNNNKKSLPLGKLWGRINSRSEFLTLFDTCYSFLSDIDDELVNALVSESVMKAKEPMKSVWKPRAYHHIKLLVDGLCKQRCLFQDYDDTFAAKPEDYSLVKKILDRMIKGWDTDLSVKQDYSRGIF